MTKPNVILWALAASAASALAFPGAWVLVALVPAAVAVAAAWWPPRPHHAAPRRPAQVSVTITQMWLYGHSAAGSMDLTAELAWRRKYEIPAGLPVTTMEAGSGPPISAPAPRPYLIHFDPRPPSGRELLERLADTADHTAIARQLARAADLEAQDRDRDTYLARLADQARAIRKAALDGLQ